MEFLFILGLLISLVGLYVSAKVLYNQTHIKAKFSIYLGDELDYASQSLTKKIIVSITNNGYKSFKMTGLFCDGINSTFVLINKNTNTQLALMSNIIISASEVVCQSFNISDFKEFLAQSKKHNNLYFRTTTDQKVYLTKKQLNKLFDDLDKIKFKIPQV
jgi:hypothetical protein